MEILALENEIAIDSMSNEIEILYAEFVLMCENKEYEDEYLMEADNDSFFAKVGQVVIDMANKCVEFITNAKDNVVGLFKKKENAAALKALKDNKDKIDPTKRIKIIKGKEAETLNEYVKELLVLERQLLLTKISPDINVIPGRSSNRTIEAMEILQKMKSLEDKYDSKFISEHQQVIELASKDAIRFSEKQLKDVELDFDAIMKNSKKVLRQFKTDANGCKEPVKLNILQKMIRALATKIRQVTIATGKRHDKNLAAVLALVGTSLAVAAYMNNFAGTKDKVNGAATAVKDKVKNKIYKGRTEEQIHQEYEQAMRELEEARRKHGVTT